MSSASPASASSSFAQWHHRLGHLCGSRLSALVRRGVLGNVSSGVSLDQCQGCKLGKQIQLPYPSSGSVFGFIFLSLPLSVLWALLLLHRLLPLLLNGIIAWDIYVVPSYSLLFVVVF